MALTSLEYGSTTDSVAIAVTLAGLGNSTSLVTGQESPIVSNITDKFIDALVSGQIMTGVSPTVGTQVLIYAYAPLRAVASAFTLPMAGASALTGVDAAATFDAEQRNRLKPAAAITVAAAGNRAYPFSFNVAALFGGVMPLKWGLWITNGTGAALHATAGNHWVHYTGSKYSLAV